MVFLVNGGYSVPAFAAAMLSFFNLLVIVFLLPESLNLAKNKLVLKKKFFSLESLLEALSHPLSGKLLILKFFYGLAFSIFQTTFSIYCQKIGLTSNITGYLLSYVGFMVAFVQGVLIGFLVKIFKERNLIMMSLWLMFFSFIGWILAKNLWSLAVILLPLTLSGGVLNTKLQALLTESVHKDEIGGILGISSSLDSFTRVIAPILGGFLLSGFGVSAPGFFGSILLFFQYILLIKSLFLLNSIFY